MKQFYDIIMLAKRSTFNSNAISVFCMEAGCVVIKGSFIVLPKDV